KSLILNVSSSQPTPCLRECRNIGAPKARTCARLIAARKQSRHQVSEESACIGHYRITPLALRSRRQSFVAFTVTAACWYRPSICSAQTSICAGSGTIGGTVSGLASHGTDGIGCSSVGRVKLFPHAVRPSSDAHSRSVAVDDPYTLGCGIRFYLNLRDTVQVVQDVAVRL